MAQEAERGAGGQRRQHPRCVSSQRERDSRQGDRGDRADPGREPVDPVDEVDDVDDGDDPQHGQRIGKPAELEAAEEGQGEIGDPDPGEDRDQRRGGLARQLRQRRQAAYVVDDANRGDRIAPSRIERLSRRSAARSSPPPRPQPGSPAPRAAASGGRVIRVPWAGRSPRPGRRAARRRGRAARRSQRLRERRGRRLMSRPFAEPGEGTGALRLPDGPEDSLDQEAGVAGWRTPG